MRDVTRLIVRSLIPVVKTTVFYNHATHVLHFTNGEIFDSFINHILESTTVRRKSNKDVSRLNQRFHHL